MEDTIGRWLAEKWTPQEKADEVRRPVVFDDPERPLDSRILWRPALAAGTRIAGPAVIEEPNSTILVPPGDRAEIDPWGNVVITLAERA
jgi:N-methylhydantoinase A